VGVVERALAGSEEGADHEGAGLSVAQGGVAAGFVRVSGSADADDVGAGEPEDRSTRAERSPLSSDGPSGKLVSCARGARGSPINSDSGRKLAPGAVAKGFSGFCFGVDSPAAARGSGFASAVRSFDGAGSVNGSTFSSALTKGSLVGTAAAFEADVLDGGAWD
jgi:hypothetical protein